MYSIDGVPLANATYGWRLKLANTNPYTGRARSLVDFNTSGRDGTVQVRGFTQTPTITLNVTTSQTRLDDLKQLFTLGSTLTLTSDATRSAVVELVSLSVTPLTLAGVGIFLVSATMRLPQVFWRDVTPVTSSTTTITSSGQVVNVFAPSTAPITDALISVKGSITGLVISASNGTSFGYAPNVPSTTYLTFDSATGRAWTGTTAFAKTTEVTGSITNGRGPYFLELIGSSNPATTGTNLTVTYSAASGATIAVQGRNSYDV